MCMVALNNRPFFYQDDDAQLSTLTPNTTMFGQLNILPEEDGIIILR